MSIKSFSHWNGPPTRSRKAGSLSTVLETERKRLQELEILTPKGKQKGRVSSSPATSPAASDETMESSNTAAGQVKCPKRFSEEESFQLGILLAELIRSIHGKATEKFKKNHAKIIFLFEQLLQSYSDTKKEKELKALKILELERDLVIYKTKLHTFEDSADKTIQPIL